MKRGHRIKRGGIRPLFIRQVCGLGKLLGEKAAGLFCPVLEKTEKGPR